MLTNALSNDYDKYDTRPRDYETFLSTTPYSTQNFVQKTSCDVITLDSQHTQAMTFYEHKSFSESCVNDVIQYNTTVFVSALPEVKYSAVSSVDRHTSIVFCSRRQSTRK